MRTESIIKKIGKTADKNNNRIWIVGGYVRDLLLNRKSKDLDFVVLGSGLDFAKILAKEFNIQDQVYFEQFDTARLKYGDYVLEFAGARKEDYPKDSRKPSVKAASLEQDLKRRDFTINALAMSVNKESFGEIVDEFNGRQDLKKEMIKTVQEPDKTFSEDPLRMLRAVRFAGQLGFSIDSAIFDSISRTKERIKIISGERINEELSKILMTKKPSDGFRQLYILGLLDLILPEVSRLGDVKAPLHKGHKDILEHTFKVLDNICEKSDNLWLRWVALLHDIGKFKTRRYFKGKGWTFRQHDIVGAKMANEIGRRLAWTREQTKYVRKMVRWHQQIVNLCEQEVSDSAVRRVITKFGGSLEDLLIFTQADLTSANPRTVAEKRKHFDELLEHIDKVKEIDELRAFQSPVRGEEIMEITGLPPSKKIGEIKKQIEEAILEGEIPNEYEAAKEYLLKKIIKK